MYFVAAQVFHNWLRSFGIFITQKTGLLSPKRIVVSTLSLSGVLSTIFLIIGAYGGSAFFFYTATLICGFKSTDILCIKSSFFDLYMYMDKENTSWITDD